MVAGCNIKKSHITMTIALLSALQFLNPIFVSNLSFISNSLPTNDISLDSIEDTIIQRAAAQEPSGGDSVASPEEEKDKDQGAMSPLDPGAVDENTPRAVQEGEDNPNPDGGRPFSGTGTIVREDICADGIDNDGDGLTDTEDVEDCTPKEEAAPESVQKKGSPYPDASISIRCVRPYFLSFTVAGLEENHWIFVLFSSGQLRLGPSTYDTTSRWVTSGNGQVNSGDLDFTRFVQGSFGTGVVTFNVYDGGPHLSNTVDPPDFIENLRNPLVSRTFNPHGICYPDG
jgi:hypothetical protein